MQNTASLANFTMTLFTLENLCTEKNALNSRKYANITPKIEKADEISQGNRYMIDIRKQ